MEVEDFDVIRQETLNVMRRSVSGEISSEKIVLHNSLGFPVLRKCPFAVIASNTLIYASGNHLVILNTLTRGKTIIQGLRCGGITCVAVDSSQKYFAFGEKHASGPNIYVYTCNPIVIVSVLRGGAVSEYSHLGFAPDTDDEEIHLLSVSAAPDYNLCIWDAVSEHLLLRSRAFATDTYAAAFCPFAAGVLVSSGPAHIKFWKIADTFTGLKLQGSLGRFGAYELSDILAFVFLPVVSALKKGSNEALQSDAPAGIRVLSATDVGPLLLWEDGLVLTSITIPSPVSSCFLLPEQQSTLLNLPEFTLVCACKDGNVHLFDVSSLTNYDLSLSLSSLGNSLVSTAYNLEVPLLFTIKMDNTSNAVNKTEIPTESESPKLLYCDCDIDDAILHAIDETGQLWRCDLGNMTTKVTSEFHSGPVHSIASAPRTHSLATVGLRSLKLYDTRISAPSPCLVCSINLPSCATQVIYLPSSVDPFCSSIAIGFEDGSLRFYQHSASDPSKMASPFECFVTHAFRPFYDSISVLCFSISGELLVAGTLTGSLFFFRFDEFDSTEGGRFFSNSTQVTPYATIKLNVSIQSISCSRHSDFIICSNNLPIILKTNFKAPYGESFNYIVPESDYSIEQWTLESYPPPKEKEQDETQVQKPEEITLPITFSHGNINCINEKYFLAVISRSDNIDELRICSLDEPNGSILLMKTRVNVKITCYALCPPSSLVVGCSNGVVVFYPTYPHVDDIPKPLTSHSTNGDFMFWKSAVHIDSAQSITSSFDMSMFYSCGNDGSIIIFRNQMRRIGGGEYVTDCPTVFPGMDLKSEYTIQEEKIKTKQDEEFAIALERKSQMLLVFCKLREQFENVYKANQDLPECERVPEEMFQLDQGLTETYEKATEDKIKRMNQEMQWESEKIKVQLKKLQSRFYEPILSHVFSVSKISCNQILYSFRTENIPPSFVSKDIRERVVEKNLVEQRKSLNSPDRTSSPKNAFNAAARIDERRKARAQRQELLKTLMEKKPSANNDDPKLMEEILIAERLMGDYKLKSDKNYVVPEHQIVNAEVKLGQYSMLRASLVDIMEVFNNKIRVLQEKRIQTIGQLSRRAVKIRKIIAKLLQYDYLYEYNETTHVLVELNQQGNADKKTALQVTSIVRGLKYRLKLHVRENQSSISRFENLFDVLFYDRVNVAIDVKNAEIRLLLLYQEWKLLKDFAKNDKCLSDKVLSKATEKKEINSRIQEMQTKMDEKRAAVESCIKKKKTIEREVTEVIGENNKFEDILLKLFRKKVKRKKVATRLDDDDFSDSSDYESDGSGDEISELCPPNCEIIHSKILKLREDRQDIEEKLGELQKSVDACRKEFDVHVKREKAIVASLKSAEQETQEFQSLKQQKLNELLAVAPLTLLQIQYFEEDLKYAIIFSKDGLKKLEGRIQVIIEETEQVKIKHRELKQEHVNLISARKEKRSLIYQAEHKCNETQMLKFGKAVEFEELEKLGTNKNADELQQTLTERERQWSRELTKCKKEIELLGTELKFKIQENTKHLEEKYRLGQQKKKLEKYLDSHQRNVVADIGSCNDEEIIGADCEKLKAIARNQTKIIQALQVELTLLMQKN